MYNLPKRKTLTEWIDVGDGGKLKVDYPKAQQIHKLQDIMADASSTMSVSDMFEYARWYLKFVIKDWKNFLCVDGEEVECKLHNNELSDDVWFTLTSDANITLEIYNTIENELRWIDIDKKK